MLVKIFHAMHFLQFCASKHNAKSFVAADFDAAD